MISEEINQIETDINEKLKGLEALLKTINRCIEDGITILPGSVYHRVIKDAITACAEGVHQKE